MRNRLAVAVAALAVFAPLALAGTSAEQVMEQMANCRSCSVYMKHPTVAPALRWSVHPTTHGFVSVASVADESLVAELRKLDAACDAKQAEIAAMTAAEQEAHLCTFCGGMVSLMARGDIDLERYPTALGSVVLASSETEEGTAALHAYAISAKETNDLLTEAFMKMKSGPADGVAKKAAKKATGY